MTKFGGDRRRLLLSLGIVLPWLCTLPSAERTARAAERVTLACSWPKIRPCKT